MKSKTKSMQLALIGYGKMGRAIEKIALKRGHTIICKISSKNLQDFNPRVLQWADMAIEFSTPDSAFNNIKQCIETGIPVVSGTTGWLNQKSEIDDLCREKGGAFLYTSNFSIGVNIFFEVNKLLAKLMNKYEVYDVDITETHHIEKKDRPSGTAINIANDIIDNLDRKKVWTITKPDAPNTRNLFIDSIRKDAVPGIHTVRYTSEIDNLEITHTSHSRKGFAQGAILAAEWLLDKKGVFEMSDVLNGE